MTTALGIAGVSAVLRNLLNDGFINNNVSGVIGSTVTVSIGPPDRVASDNGTEASQLNLFLHRVTANAGWNNQGYPAYDSAGRERLSNPPLALNLHYLLSAHSAADLHGEILLGYAMQLLHESPVLSREAIGMALNAEPSVGNALPPALRALADSGLEDQLELIKVTPEYLSTEEISKLWSATLSHMRPTAAYVASVVLIQATDPVRAPIPVLSRGPLVNGRERGVMVEPSLIPPIPTIEKVVPAAGGPVAALGQIVGLTGHHLAGSSREVTLVNDRYGIDASIGAEASGGEALIEFQIPVAQAADFPAGLYRVGARMVRPGETDPRLSNLLAMTLAPQIIGLPMNVSTVGGTASFSLDFHPAVREGQSVSLVLGQHECQPEEFSTPTTTLDFVIQDAPLQPAPGHLARLRIDGIDSPIIDFESEPPQFLDQRIVIS